MDWGSESHQVCILDREGQVLGEKAFSHSGEGFHQMMDWMRDTAGCDLTEIATSIEVPHGPVVESLMERGIQVFSINPKQLDRFRDRFSPAGAKDDRRDARVLADALRTDPDRLRALDPEDSDIIPLREWSRMEAEFTAQRTRLMHQLRAQLWRYFPQFLRLKFRLDSPVLMALWTLIPTPARARRVRLRSVQKVLKEHRIRRLSAEEVLQFLRAKPLTVADGVEQAATQHIRLVLQQLELLGKQIQEIKQNIESILGSLHENPPSQEICEPENASSGQAPSSRSAPPDVEILLSIPGIGSSVAATLLSEASSAIQARDYQALRCLCGTAPVTKRSGKSHRVVQRKAHHARLANSVYHWSRVSTQRDPISKAKYKALRDRGHKHGRSLRSVGDRLLAVACAMLRDQTLYDPSRQTMASRTS